MREKPGAEIASENRDALWIERHENATELGVRVRRDKKESFRGKRERERSRKARGCRGYRAATGVVASQE